MWDCVASGTRSSRVINCHTERGQKGKLLQPSTMSNDDDYYEEQVWPLTSHTNCYTAYTRDGRWATQRHVCWHDVTKNDATTTTTDKNSRATTTTVRWRELPPGRLCVGYSSVSSCAAPYGWEAYGLLPDQHWQQQQQQSEEPQPTTPLPVPVVSTSTYSSATAMDGTTTTFSNDNIITAAAGGHSRSPSLVGLPSASELDSMYNSVPELSSSLDNNDYPLTEPEATTRGGRADHNNNNNNNVAELIVRNYMSTTGDGATTSNGENRVQHYSLWLSYRPTAIHITMTLFLLKNDQATKTTTTTATTTPLVWMGSADHAQLHSYEIAAINNKEPDVDSGGDNDDDENDIDPALQLRHNHEFPASVLAIASNSDGRKLVVASQDGSIVILQLCNGDGDDRRGGEGTSCRLVTEATVIIDGPILALSYQQDGTITIGSLCGYVARMKDDGTKLEMIVEGFTGHNSQEDAVLAVAATSTSDNNGDGHRIWVGTRSGRCLLYRLCHSDDPSSSRPVAPSSSSSSSSCWKLEWQVRLPYAVNGIWLRDNDVVVDDARRQNRVIVTTARGIHIFRTVHSAVQQARSRLNDLLLK
jgi:hypothetical protein